MNKNVTISKLDRAKAGLSLVAIITLARFCTYYVFAGGKARVTPTDALLGGVWWIWYCLIVPVIFYIGATVMVDRMRAK